jgi:dethiobiotin synthetase
MRALFVTGTDTGAGKTFVTCALAAALAERGLSVGVFKPIETGCELHERPRVGADCERLLAAAGGRQDPSTVASYLFGLPAAPLVAAANERVTIDIERIARDFAAVASAHDFTLVEGAGGLMVPIRERFTYLDLVRRLELPVLVVVGSRLGCINHALLTLSALDSAGATTAGFVVNCLDPETDGPASPSRNHDAIAAFTNARDLGLFSHQPADVKKEGQALFSRLAEKIGSGTIFSRGEKNGA